MDSRWPLHSSENKHLARETRDFDLNIAENEPLDMSLGFNATANAQSHSNSPQVPILTTQNHYQNVDASYSQVYFSTFFLEAPRYMLQESFGSMLEHMI